MDPATAAADYSPDRPGPIRRVRLVLGWLALLVYFHTPVREVLAPTLDGSNYGSYAYFTAHHFQYGTEIVPMAGPYGFIMYGWTYSGDLFWTRTVAELLLNAALATLTLWFFFQWRGAWIRWLWLAAHVAFTPYVEDLPIEWILLLGGLYLLQLRPQAPARDRAWAAAISVLLALVSLVKGTQLLLSGATVAVVLGAHAGQRRWRDAGLVAAAYLGGLLAWWLAAGQNPLHLPAYVHGILELGGGYTEAMGIPTPAAIFDRALLVTAALAVTLAWMLWRHRRAAGTAAACLLLAGHTFAQWKHSIVRADGHAYIYFHYATVAALAAYLVAWQADRRAPAGRWTALGGRALLAATLLLAAWGPSDPQLPGWRAAPSAALKRLGANSRYLLFLPAIHRGFEAGLAGARREHALPQVDAEVGPQAIDAFGVEHGLLLLNGLNYRPRPMGGGSFNAYTPYLMGLNRDFLRDDARRPGFYLFRLHPIDGRLAAQEDGAALLEILQRYRPRLIEHEHLLMELAPGGPPAAAPRAIGRWTGRFGEAVPVPAVGADEVLLARFIVRESLLGRLRAFLYKPAPVFIELPDASGPGRHRLVPAMARVPFILAPQLEEHADVVDLYERGAGRFPREFRVTTDAPAGFAAKVTVEFLAAPRPAPLTPAALAELRGRLQFPFANAVPVAITPAFRPSPSVRFLHPPAEAAWTLAGDERSFVFHYGIDPEAYERGTTNGVDFIVEIRGPSGGTHAVARFSLKPRENPADRGDHTARVALPIFTAGSKLVLRTDPGAFGDNSWDWAWVNRIELRRDGGYAADLFPGFSRIPDSADDENAAALDLEGGRVLLLHVPGRVGFVLNGPERRLTLGFGFLPGAYTGDGHTQGADYIVEVTHGGAPAREIYRRRLQPVTDDADRGAQSAAIDLPGIAAGDVLTVRTAPIPGGNSSWGWTYLSRVVLE